MTFLEYLQDLSLYLVGAFLLVGAMLAYTYKRAGSWAAFKAHFATTGDGAWGGIIKATMAVIIFTLIAWMINQKAEASELRWFDQTVVYAGIDATKDVSPQCYANDVDDRLTSNVGFRQNIVRKDGLVMAMAV